MYALNPFNCSLFSIRKMHDFDATLHQTNDTFLFMRSRCCRYLLKRFFFSFRTIISIAHCANTMQIIFMPMRLQSRLEEIIQINMELSQIAALNTGTTQCKRIPFETLNSICFYRKRKKSVNKQIYLRHSDNNSLLKLIGSSAVKNKLICLLLTLFLWESVARKRFDGMHWRKMVKVGFRNRRTTNLLKINWWKKMVNICFSVMQAFSTGDWKNINSVSSLRSCKFSVNSNCLVVTLTHSE